MNEKTFICFTTTTCCVERKNKWNTLLDTDLSLPTRNKVFCDNSSIFCHMLFLTVRFKNDKNQRKKKSSAWDVFSILAVCSVYFLWLNESATNYKLIALTINSFYCVTPSRQFRHTEFYIIPRQGYCFSGLQYARVDQHDLGGVKATKATERKTSLFFTKIYCSDGNILTQLCTWSIICGLGTYVFIFALLGLNDNENTSPLCPNPYIFILFPSLCFLWIPTLIIYYVLQTFEI